MRSDLRDELTAIGIREGHPDAERARILVRRLEEAASTIEAPWSSAEQRDSAVAFVRRASALLADLTGSTLERDAKHREVLLELCQKSAKILRGARKSELWESQGVEALDTSAGIVVDKFTSLAPDVAVTDDQLRCVRALLVALVENTGGAKTATKTVKVAREELLAAMGWKVSAATAAKTARRRRAREQPEQ